MYNMEKISTAEEFLNKEYYHIILDSRDTWINVGDIKRAMIEFAKLHVEAALKEAEYCRTKECIQKCYPLDNIK
jgi:hypothetical protein